MGPGCVDYNPARVRPLNNRRLTLDIIEYSAPLNNHVRASPNEMVRSVNVVQVDAYR